MNDIIKIGLTILIGSALLIVIGWAVLTFAVHMSTCRGSFVIIPENSQPFPVREVVFINSNAVVYTKPDGTSGRISGNFRVEDAISTIIEKK